MQDRSSEFERHRPRLFGIAYRMLSSRAAAPAADASAELSSSLSIAFLVVLEQLSPDERAVFLLREVFDSTVAGNYRPSMYKSLDCGRRGLAGLNGAHASMRECDTSCRESIRGMACDSIET